MTEHLLVVGLGNPGIQYEMTRHNLGYLVVQSYAERLGWVLKQDRRFNAKVVKGVVNGKVVHLLQPLTYMNLSGESVKRYIEFYKIDHSHLVIVCDDIAIDFGSMRLKPCGSAGGHNGLKSIWYHLETWNFMRLRMGVGPQPEQWDLADFVLSAFDEEERKKLPAFIERGVQVVEQLLTENVTTIMNRVNTAPEKVKLTPNQGKDTIDLTKPPLAGRGEKL